MPPRPDLNPKTVDDDQLLAHGVDHIIKTDPEASAVQVEILRLQHDLRELAGPDGWAAYLTIEEQVTARWSELSLVLVRWAFTEGVKSCCGRTS